MATFTVIMLKKVGRCPGLTLTSEERSTEDVSDIVLMVGKEIDELVI
jgi:hypothetical protein